jgi:pyridoxal phosphate enzyme (YggS family)
VPAASSESGRLHSNLQRIREAVDKAAQGRVIRLVCVTKYASERLFDLLLETGVEEIGESHFPQAAQRYERIRTAGRSCICHLIGAQQSRKVKQIPGACDVFQALDRLKTAEMLNAELVSRNQQLPVLLEVNVDAEPQKHGFDLAALESAVSGISQNCPQLLLQGLMALPRARAANDSTDDWEMRTRMSFGQMRTMFDKIEARFPELTEWSTLSMGMSQDYAWAIAEGSTMVRIGSALFAGLEG